MQHARAASTGEIVDAPTLESRDEQERESILVQLRCPECDARTFFRRTARNGRRAHFFAPHAEGCSQAVTGGGYDQRGRDEQRLGELLDAGAVVELHADQLPPAPTGATTDQAAAPSSRAGHTRARSGDSNAPAGQGPEPGRPLRALLRYLIHHPELADSDALIETLPGRRWRARNLLVPFAEAEPDPERPHIYWGRLVSADAQCKWLNTGGPEAASIDVIALRHDPQRLLGIGDPPAQIPGAHALVFGWCTAARSGKPIIRALKPRPRHIVIEAEPT